MHLKINASFSLLFKLYNSNIIVYQNKYFLLIKIDAKLII